MRKNIILGIVAFVIIGLGVGAYFLFVATAPQVTVAPTGSASLPVAGQQSTSGASGAAQQGTTPSAGNMPVAVSARLIQISAGPIVPGEVVINKKAANASSTPEVTINYIERGSGNIFSYLTHAKTLTRINNKTLPGIESADWFPDASAALVRYLSGADLSTINTYALTATSSGGFFLQQNISDVAVSTTGILSVASGVNGSVVSLGHLDGTKTATIFTTPLTSIRASFAGKNNYLVFSKPSSTLSGDVFLVDLKGRFSRIAGPLHGLVALASPSGKWVLVSSFEGNAMQMKLVSTLTMDSIVLPVATIADKCVWTADDASVYCGVPLNPSASYAYPDDWYQGAVRFSDRIWKIDVAGRYAQLVLDFSQAQKGDLDAESLAVDPSNTTLVFTNKNDGSLWSYSL